MHGLDHVEHHEPTRGEAISFYLKSRILIAGRWWKELGKSPLPHPVADGLKDSPILGTAKGKLWTQISEAEFPLTAGKVQNLRSACRKLDGIEVPAGEVFSFWKQLGRTTRSKGFTDGRELRSGCMVPNLGGGLCQLSGQMHAAAVAAGLEIVEKHEHSRSLPGVTPDPERDATVFWNYVDLRFRASFPWRLEAYLTGTELVVTIRSSEALEKRIPDAAKPAAGIPSRALADGDCLTCNVVSCFRNPRAVAAHGPSAGHTAFLLDGRWPEFDDWCVNHSHEGDYWISPMNGKKWKKSNYAWSPPPSSRAKYCTFRTLWNSWKQRRLPSQGAVRQRFLLDSQKDLAKAVAQHLDPLARHLIISQTLLPYLQLSGHLGGRTYDVLVNRWPMHELHRRLDEAGAKQPASDTLVDFRADAVLVEAERRALEGAARIITPHRGIATYFGSKTILLDWKIPAVENQPQKVDGPKWFFPASALGRKGIWELAQVLPKVGGELLVLGRAKEGTSNPLDVLNWRKGDIKEISECTAVVIPAWIEHEPRLALKALAMGVPVIASSACGLPAHPLFTEIEAGDCEALENAMLGLTKKDSGAGTSRSLHSLLQ